MLDVHGEMNVSGDVIAVDEESGCDVAVGG